MIRFPCISDLHLDAVTYGVARMEEIDHSVRAQLAEVRKGDEVVFLGDLGNPGSPRIYEAISRAIQYDREVRNRGGRIHWMVGNHDVLEDGSGGSVLEPLRGYGALVYSEPDDFMMTTTGSGLQMVFLPHAPLSKRYDPGSKLKELLARRTNERVPAIVFGHLNPSGITPGSEAEAFARGRDVMWPEDRPLQRNVLYVSGHIHRAQEYPKRQVHDVRDWGAIQIVGAPVRFGFGEADYEPQTFVATWGIGEDWFIARESIEKKLAPLDWLSRFITIEEETEIGPFVRDGDFVRSSLDGAEEQVRKCAYALAGVFPKQYDLHGPPPDVKPARITFVPMPKLAQARPKASVEKGARRHRRVRDIATTIAAGYETWSSGLDDVVDKILTGNEL